MPGKRPHRDGSSRTIRTLVFLALAVGIVGLAINFSRPKELALIEIGPGPSLSAAMATGGSDAFDLTLRIDMGGFTPPQLEGPADRPIRLRIVNPDNSHHSDGGGVHGFTVPSLGVDVKVPPLTTMVITIPAAPAGEYAFYCDTCCGGKENPTMNSTIRMRA